MAGGWWAVTAEVLLDVGPAAATARCSVLRGCAHRFPEGARAARHDTMGQPQTAVAGMVNTMSGQGQMTGEM